MAPHLISEKEIYFKELAHAIVWEVASLKLAGQADNRAEVNVAVLTVKGRVQAVYKQSSSTGDLSLSS